MWEYSFGVLGHSVAVDEDCRGIRRKVRLPGPGSQLIPGDLRADSVGTKAPEARAVGELAPLQARFSQQVLVRTRVDPLISGDGSGKTPALDGQPGAPFHVSGLRPLGYREPRADHEGRSPRGRLALTPRSPAPPIPGCDLGSPRDSPEPPLPQWTCPGTPVHLAGHVCAASPWLEHYGEPGAPNGRDCSL